MNKRTGRTLDAVLNPKNYPPFAGIDDHAQFEQLWQHKPMAVLAHIAHAAYCAPAEVEKILAKFGATVRFYRSQADVNGIIRGRYALLACWADKTILAFRGTDGAKPVRIQTPEFVHLFMDRFGITMPEQVSTLLATDVLDDLDFVKIPYKNSLVHRGFLSAANELWPAIERDLAALNLSAAEQVFATGHSLGGAMAVISGMSYPFRQIVTFGEPRVGRDIGYSLDSGTAHIRYVNGDDPVPRLAPSGFPFFYEHHGELRGIVDSAYGGPNALYDHSIVNYAEILSEALAIDFQVCL